MSKLDHTLEQISEMENEIYSNLRETKDLDRIRLHGENYLQDAMSLQTSNKSVENLLIAQGDESAKNEADSLRELVGARAWVMMAKHHVVDEFSSRIKKRWNPADEQDAREFAQLRDDLVTHYNGDCSDVTGNAKVFKETVD